MTHPVSPNRITVAALAVLVALALWQLGLIAPRNLVLVNAAQAIDPGQRPGNALVQAQAGLETLLNRTRTRASRADDVLWRALGLVYEAQGKAEAALNAWSSDPASTALMLNRGSLAEYRQDPDAALVWYSYASELSPQQAWPRYRLGAVYEDLADLPSAEEQYRKAAEIAPSNRDVWFGLARVLLNQGKIEPALDALQHGADASEGRIGRSALYFQIGRVYERDPVAPNLASAEAAYRRASELDDYEAVPLWRGLPDIRLGEIYSERGDYASALAQFEAALMLNPDSYDAGLGQASALLNLGRSDDAETVLQGLIDRHPERAGAYWQLVRLYEAQGEDAKAKDLRTKVSGIAAP